jgi:hypothetical protein
MYHAALRASEICETPHANHTLKASQLLLNKTHNSESLKIDFKSYKHSNHETTPLVIYTTGTPTCPIRAYKLYRLSQPQTNGFAFINKDKSPVTRQQIADTLQTLLKPISSTPKHFNTHSFRIGKATDMANKGYSYAQIAMLGRWRSNAFLKYIKPTIIHGTN